MSPNIWLYLLGCLYFMLPAYFANMVPPILKRVGLFKFLAGPVDFNRKFRGQPIFGSHKTWRGIIFGIIVGILVAWFQSWLYQFSLISQISPIDYHQINILLFGFLISGGAVFGDLFFSFLKRRQNMEPGKAWPPFDQLDYVLGTFLFLVPYLRFDLIFYFAVLILTFFLNISATRLGYFLGLRDNKW